jgi:hypothetical protein
MPILPQPFFPFVSNLIASRFLVPLFFRASNRAGARYNGEGTPTRMRRENSGDWSAAFARASI